MDKGTIRRKIAERRNIMGKAEAELKSNKIQRMLLGLHEFRDAATIAFYVAKKSENEVDTEYAIRKALEYGKRVLVPVTDTLKKNIMFSELRDFDRELVRSTFGVLEPKEECRRYVDPEHFELVILPGVAFDRKGNRIGHGFGYYDRFLSTVKRKFIKIGFAYAFQIVDEIPAAEDDVKVDRIITETSVIAC
jgi:5-formyltetrahydrofolate cyclo-ligase